MTDPKAKQMRLNYVPQEENKLASAVVKVGQARCSSKNQTGWLGRVEQVAHYTHLRGAGVPCTQTAMRRVLTHTRTHTHRGIMPYSGPACRRKLKNFHLHFL